MPLFFYRPYWRSGCVHLPFNGKGTSALVAPLDASVGSLNAVIAAIKLLVIKWREQWAINVCIG